MVPPALVLRPDPRRGFWAAPGDSLRLACSSTGSRRSDRLSMFVMGWSASKSQFGASIKFDMCKS